MRSPVALLLADARGLSEVLEMVNVSDTHKLIRFRNKLGELTSATDNLLAVKVGEKPRDGDKEFIHSTPPEVSGDDPGLPS
jgi:hypothetical protein